MRAGEDDPPCRVCGGILKSTRSRSARRSCPRSIDRGDARRRASCDLLLAVGSTLQRLPGGQRRAAGQGRTAPGSSSSTASRPRWTASPTPSASGRSASSCPRSSIVTRESPPGQIVDRPVGYPDRPVGFRAMATLPRSARRRPRPRSPRSTPPRPTSSASRPGAVVLDVREPDEYEQGAIPGAVHIPRGHLESAGRGPARSTRTRRSSSTAPAACARRSPPRRCSELGYTDVVVDGRRLQQVEGRGPRRGRRRSRSRPSSATATSATCCCPRSASRARPSCSTRKVLLLGAGGLGSPAALYLAAAGVGTIGIVDMDEVDASQPAAPDPPQPRPHRRPQGRLGQEDAHAAQPRRRRRHLRHPPRRRQHHGHHRRLRRRRRRRRQLPEPLPAQRRLA